MMVTTSVETKIRLVVWLVLGMIIYFFYGENHSRVQKGRTTSQDLGAIQGHVAQFDQSCLLTESQHLHEQISKRLQMLLPETGDGVVIGMLIGGQIPERTLSQVAFSIARELVTPTANAVELPAK